MVSVPTSHSNMGLSILHLGPISGTSRHRAEALKRLGHSVSMVDPRQFLPDNHAVSYWIHHAGARFLTPLVRKRLLNHIAGSCYDLVLVSGGHLVDADLATELKRRFGVVVNYNVDDPFGRRDGQKWRSYLAAVPIYDLVVVVRDCNIEEAFAAGARRVLRVHRSADEVAHAPRRVSLEERDRWASEVVFVGTWMPERGPFMARLVELGVPLTIYGDRWQKAKEWPMLRPFWRGPGLHTDEEYALAVQCSKVCLGLLSKGNRDLATQRSFEIPHLGSVLCAERTDEHLSLYREGDEAVFWSTPEECAEKCAALLASEDWRLRVSRQGRARCISNNTVNEAILDCILTEALQPERDRSKVCA